MQRDNKGVKSLEFGVGGTFADLLSFPSAGDIQTALAEKTWVHSVFPAAMTAGKLRHLSLEKFQRTSVSWRKVTLPIFQPVLL